MANYAVIRNGVVINKIVADTQEIAETVTGFDCVEYTEDNEAQIGLNYENGVFEQYPYIQTGNMVLEEDPKLIGRDPSTL